MNMAANRSQNGIKFLKTAEQEAQHIVNAARTAKQDRLKQAKEEANEEVKAFRKQMEADFENKVLENSGDSDANVKRLDQDTDTKIDHLKKEASRISPDVVSMLLRHVTTEFEKKQQIMSRDRDLILSMFTPPTANQSWRKVLSMGNLLNGHEPILREIIFSKRDCVSGSYYAASSPKHHQQDIETYRMYASGTSNDLGVALAVASID